MTAEAGRYYFQVPILLQIIQDLIHHHQAAAAEVHLRAAAVLVHLSPGLAGVGRPPPNLPRRGGITRRTI